MTRKHLTAAVAVTLIALSAPAAEAGKPERVRLPPFESFVDPPGAACPEAIAPEGILWEDAGGNAAATFYEDGTFALRGRHPDRVTNVATGTSVLMKLQGSVVTTPLPDGASETRLSGTQGFVFFPDDVGPGDDDTGRIYVFKGEARLVQDEFGAVTDFTLSGTKRDICAELA